VVVVSLLLHKLVHPPCYTDLIPNFTRREYEDLISLFLVCKPVFILSKGLEIAYFSKTYAASW
jgi:hypothetical protein